MEFDLGLIILQIQNLVFQNMSLSFVSLVVNIYICLFKDELDQKAGNYVSLFKHLGKTEC